MANWVKCTHKGDEQPVYVNVDAAMSMRWIESDNATIIVYAGGEIDVVRVCFESNRYAGRMSAAVQSNIARLVRRYFDSGTKRLDVTWYGGEPLLAFSVVERLSKRFLSLCEEFGREYSAEIVTNGTLMSHEKAQQLASWKVKRAQITLDGVPELHDARRVPKNRKPTFCTILDGIDAAAAHMHVSVRINVCRKVAARLEELLQILAARGLNRVVSVYVPPLQKVEDRKTLPSRGPQARVSSVAPQPDGEQLDALDGREAADLELRFNDLLWKYGFAVSNRLPEPRCTTCMADKEHSWLIEANGDVQKCYWTAGLRAEAAGRLTEDGIAPREPYRKWQDWTAFRNTGCLQCIMLPICLGRCPTIAQPSSTIGFMCWRAPPECRMDNWFLFNCHWPARMSEGSHAPANERPDRSRRRRVRARQNAYRCRADHDQAGRTTQPLSPEKTASPTGLRPDQACPRLPPIPPTWPR